MTRKTTAGFGEDGTKVIERGDHRAVVSFIESAAEPWYVAVEDDNGETVWDGAFKSRWEAEHSARESLRAHNTFTNVEPQAGTAPTSFVPPHSKDDAGYRIPSDPSFDHDHDRCGDCVHYIEGGGCHFVSGRISPNAYCEQFYADYGVFAHEHENHVEVNAELVGDAFDFEDDDVVDLVDEIEERLEQRLREDG